MLEEGVNSVATGFKRSIKGYDPVSVMNQLSSLDQEFAQRREELRTNYAAQEKLKQSIVAEIEQLRTELAPRLSLQDDISRRLVMAHLKGSQKVLTALQTKEQKESALNEQLNRRKIELDRLHIVTGKMSNEFLATATRYGTILRSGKEGEIVAND